MEEHIIEFAQWPSCPITHFSECILVIKWSTTVSPCVYLLLNNATEIIFQSFLIDFFCPLQNIPSCILCLYRTSKVFQCLWGITSSISSVSSLLEPSLPQLQSGHHAWQVCLHDHFRTPDVERFYLTQRSLAFAFSYGGWSLGCWNALPDRSVFVGPGPLATR